MSANFNPTLNGYSGQGSFRFWCQKVLPLVYDDSLSYYELLNKMVIYLNNVISDVATVEDNVSALANAFDQLNTYVSTYFDNLDVQEEINNKLDKMAESGELSEILWYIVGYVTPEMFGAVGDGEMNDFDAIQDAIYAAQNNGTKTVVLARRYYIEPTEKYNNTAFLTVPGGITIKGLVGYRPTIIAHTPINPVFKCIGKNNLFENMYIRNDMGYNQETGIKDVNVYREFTAIELCTDELGNCDSKIIDVDTAYCGTGIEITGKNVYINGCTFMHNRYGVKFNIPTTGAITATDGMRGMRIEGNRFHGIGEETDINFTNSACIYVRFNKNMDLSIKDNLADQSGTFFDGCAGGFLMENNTVICTHEPAVNIFRPDGFNANPINKQAYQIIGNSFRGINIDMGDGGKYPDNLININGVDNVLIENNNFARCVNEAIRVRDCDYCYINGNTAGNISTNATANYIKRFVTSVVSNALMTITNNYIYESNCRTVYREDGDGSTIKCLDNVNNVYTQPTISDNTWTNKSDVMKQYIDEKELFNTKPVEWNHFGAECNYNITELRDGLYIVRTGVEDLSDTTYFNFTVAKIGRHFTSSCQIIDSTHIAFLKVVIANTNATSPITFKLYILNIANGTLNDTSTNGYFLIKIM